VGHIPSSSLFLIVLPERILFMAKELAEWPGKYHTRLNGMYPLDLWFNGKIWELKMGKDFNCMLGSMQTSLYSNAKKRGITIRTHVDGKAKTVVVQKLNNKRVKK
jgi:hypothetical protein